VPVFISPRNKVAQLYPWALGSLFVTSYDSQGYGGGILTSLHTDPVIPLGTGFSFCHLLRLAGITVEVF
jgi:hypothetical protein